MNAERLIERAETLLLTRAHLSFQDASAAQLHDAISSAAMEELSPLWAEKE